MEIIGAGFKQREAMFALKMDGFKNHAFIEYFNKIRKEFEEILKILIPKAEKEQTPNEEYESFKMINECQQTINEILKRFEYAGHERIEELEKINKWVEVYKKSKKAEEIQLKFPNLKNYIKHKRSEQKKSNQPETFIKEKTDTIMKKLLKSVLSIKESLFQDMQKTETNKKLLENIICTARKAINALEYLKIIEVMQIFAEVANEECSDKIKEEGAEKREEEERKECDADRDKEGEEKDEKEKNVSENTGNTDDKSDIADIQETELPDGIIIEETTEEEKD